MKISETLKYNAVLTEDFPYIDLIFKALEDIVNKVEIHVNFSISHPDYKPLEVSENVVNDLQKLSPDNQRKYLSQQLNRYLYGIYYNGALRKSLSLSTGTTTLRSENSNDFLGMDFTFYDRLHINNQGEGYFDPNWQIITQAEDNTLVVEKSGLKLYIDRDRHLPANQKSTDIGDLVRIRLPRNLLQNGFYMAVGNAGPDGTGETLVRVYFNLSPEGAVTVMKSVTTRLNELDIPFMFKALYNPSAYDRFDSTVFYFEKNYYATIQPILQDIYAENQLFFRSEIPLFTKFLSPGLGLAEEPGYKFSDLDSFGTNRCQVIVHGLLDAWDLGDNSPDIRMQAILSYFSLLKIELHRPYLNANSDDIYTILNHAN
jgi:HopA1 effector protein family